MALAGDAAALRICIDRLIPAAKAKDDPVSLPDLPETLAGKGHAVIDALGEAKLTPDEAGTILQALATQARIVEADEIEKRVAALEKNAAAPGK